MTEHDPSILDEADALVSGARARDHGDANLCWRYTADIYTAMTGEALRPDQVPAILHALKLARRRQNPGNRDNWVDTAGYLRLWQEDHERTPALHQGESADAAACRALRATLTEVEKPLSITPHRREARIAIAVIPHPWHGNAFAWGAVNPNGVMRGGVTYFTGINGTAREAWASLRKTVPIGTPSVIAYDPSRSQPGAPSFDTPLTWVEFPITKSNIDRDDDLSKAMRAAHDAARGAATAAMVSPESAEALHPNSRAGDA